MSLRIFRKFPGYFIRHLIILRQRDVNSVLADSLHLFGVKGDVLMR